MTMEKSDTGLNLFWPVYLILLLLCSSSGEKIVVFLNMSAQNLSPVMSRNTIAEIKGREFQDQVQEQ